MRLIGNVFRFQNEVSRHVPLSQLHTTKVLSLKFPFGAGEFPCQKSEAVRELVVRFKIGIGLRTTHERFTVLEIHICTNTF